MQAERDILHQRIFPKLRKRLAAYGEDVQELDLRWGVDTSRMTEEESGKFVVEACIDSIDRCKPYMIVLLGNRYGWIPARDVVRDTGDDRIMTWCEEESSITQMEILYGALSQNELEKSVFCFRNEDFPEEVPEALRPIYAVESPRHAEKLARLKDEISSRESATILNYTAHWDAERQSAVGLEQFEEQLTEALWAMLSRDLGEPGGQKRPEERVLQESALTAERYLTTYVSREMDQQDGPTALIGRRGRWYTGEGGSGKSAMMSKIAAQARKVGVRTFLYFGGNEGCGSVDTLLSTLLFWLDQIDGKEPQEYQTMHREMLRFLLHDRLQEKRTFDWAVLIDGVDQMEEGVVPILCWMGRCMIREEQETYWHGLVVSSTEAFADRWKEELDESFGVRRLEPLTGMELNAVIQSHAARRGKKLDASVVQCLRERKSARNPYHLSLLLQKLFMMDQRDFEQAEALAPGMEGLSRYMCRELAALPEDTGEMTLAVLRAAAEKLSVRMQSLPLEAGRMAEPMEVLELLAAAKDGMALEELAEVLDEQGKTFPSMVLEQLFCFLYDSFGESEQGVWNFRHRLLRENLIAHMGAADYRRRCAALLRHAERKEGTLASRLYYAWQAGDVPAGLRCLTAPERELETAAAVFRQLMQGGADYLTALADAADAPQAVGLLSLVWNAGEAALRCRESLQPCLTRLKPGEEAPAALRFRYDLVEVAFRFWDLDPQPFCESWRRLLTDFEPFKTDCSDCITVFFQCLRVLEQSRFHSLLKETAAVLAAIREIGAAQGWIERHIAFAGLEEACAWSALLAEGEDTAADGKPEFRQRLAAFLDALPADFSRIRKTAWKAYLAHLQIEAGLYREGNDILNQLLSMLEYSYTFSGSVENGCRYVQCLLDKAKVLKPKFAVPHLQKAQAVCQSMLATCPTACLQYLQGLIGTRLWKAMEKSEEWEHQSEARRQLDETIRIFDRLVEAVGADSIPEEILLEILDQRYQRVRRCRIESDPWKHLEQQKADFAYMDTQYRALDARSNFYRAVSDLCWALTEQIRYADACHLDQELVLAGNKLLNVANSLAKRKSPGVVWIGLGAQLELAEILCRWRYVKSAVTLTDHIYETLQRVDGNWVAQRNKTEEHRRRIIRFYLMKARLILKQKGDAETGVSYLNLAAGMLDGKEGERKPLPVLDNALRSELWILLAELFRQLGKDSAVPGILDSTDALWPKEACEKALRRDSAFEDKIALLQYCRGLAMRARLREEPARMDKAIAYLRKLTEVSTRDGDASAWEELYSALMDACRYCWARRNGGLLSADLMSAMLPALAKKAEAGTLTEEEKILLAHIGLEKQSCVALPGLGDGSLPETAWLRLVLERDQALKLPTAQNRMAARLSVAHLLRGDGRAAQAALLEGTPDGSVDSVWLLELLTCVIDAICEGKTPSAPLTAQAQAWLETPLAGRETFLRAYLETLCCLADSLTAPEASPETLRRAVALLQEREKALRKRAAETVIADWTFALVEKLAAAQEAGADLAPLDYIKLLLAGVKSGGAWCDHATDPEEQDRRFMQAVAMNQKLAEACLADGDRAECDARLLWNLRQVIGQRQHLTRANWEMLLQWYERLKAERDLPGNAEKFPQKRWLELMTCGEKIWAGLYRIDRDPVWMERQAAEAALLRERLLAVEQESLSWRQEKAVYLWEYDREAWLTLLRDRPTERQWLTRYLDAVEAQLAQLGEGQERTLEDIQNELYGLETVTEAEEAAVSRVLDRTTSNRKTAESDLMYLMFQALRDLGENAEMPQVEAYIKMRRAGITAAQEG